MRYINLVFYTVVTSVKAQVEVLRKALETNEAETIRAAAKELSNVVTKMGESIYKARSAAGSSTDASSSDAPPAAETKDDAKDAEFKDRK